MRSLFLLLFLLNSFTLSAQQYFTGIATRWSDDLSEWDIYTYSLDDPEEEYDEEESPPPTGELKIRWQMRDDWNTWDYTIGEERGFVRTLFTDDPGKWEIVGRNNEVITFRQIWNNDRREWRITDNQIQINFKSRWGNRLDEWVVRETKHGDFQMYTTWEGDPRDWTIIDEMNEDISIHMKMAMVFIAMFVSGF